MNEFFLQVNEGPTCGVSTLQVSNGPMCGVYNLRVSDGSRDKLGIINIYLTIKDK